MALELDPTKDETNIRKHGISLSRALEVQLLAVKPDDRHDYGETRYQGYGLLDEQYVCLVFTYRGSAIRPISLRRAHQKEIRRHVKT